MRASLDYEVVSHFTDYFIPYDMFYNTNAHLSEEGARIRTELFIKDLRNWMSGY